MRTQSASEDETITNHKAPPIEKAENSERERTHANPRPHGQNRLFTEKEIQRET